MRWGAILILASCGRLNFGDLSAVGDGAPGAHDATVIADAFHDDGVAVLDCATNSTFLCDTFEMPSPDPMLWTLEEFNGSVTIDATMAHRGTRSMHSNIVSLPASGNSTAHAVHVADLPTNLFIRAFIRQHGTPAAGAMYLNPNAGPVGTNNAVELHNENGNLTLDSYNPVNMHTVTNATFPADTWTCVELELSGLPASGTAPVDLRVYVENVEVTALHQHVMLGPMIQIAVGLFDRSITDAWFDDLIADTTRVGCAR